MPHLMAPLPTGTVTFLFTDIEGSTNLLQQLGEDYAQALGEHQALLRTAFAAHGGAEVDTQGDAFFVAFAAAPEAVAAAAAATRALAEHTWPQGAALRVRMGLHTGTPQVIGDHYVGLDVHRAARIAACGHGGQILLSAATVELVRETLPAGCALRALGAHRLKDLRQPEPLTQLVVAGLPADFPPLKTLDTHQHNLPVQPTPLVGREEQIAALTALVRRDDVRLVTLTGSGGIGKTRLAAQVAAEVVDAFPDGVWLVRLSRLTDPALVLPTIAQTCGLKEADNQPLAEVLRAYVADKQMMLLLDNFEQVVGAAAEVAGLLAAGPGLTVLVTSRVPLRLRGEKTYPVPPLPLADPDHPPPPERLTQYAAVALFIQRAQQTKPDFAVTAANAPAIAAICAQLDGLPLAIELAAARVRLLPPEALLSRLASQLKLLTGGARDVEARQQTMRATLQWSEDLLTPPERVLLRRLAVFVGGATLEAAEAVCAAPEGAETLDMDVLEGLAELVDQSLVQQREEGGEARVGMLHVIREYALERLEASGASDGRPPEAEALRRAHAGYFLALAEQAESELTGPQQGAWLDRLQREHDNLRAALGWAHERGAAETGLRLVAAIWRFWWARGYLREGRTWVEEVLALGGQGPQTSLDAGSTGAVPARIRARALVASGWLAIFQGDNAAAAIWLDQAVALGRAASELRTTANALTALGFIAHDQGDLARARARFTEALAVSRELGDRWSSGADLTNLGDLALAEGDLEEAATAFSEALALFREEGDRACIGVCLANLGGVARKRGELTQAAALQREGLALAQELGDERRCAEMLEYLAATAGATGTADDGERAARLLGAAAAARETLGAPQPANERTDLEQAVALARADLGEERWAEAFAAGRALSLEEAVAEALGETGVES